MNKSLSAAITTMLLVTSTAWASPESQAIRPTGDNQPDHTPTEQADQMKEDHREHDAEMKPEHGKDHDRNGEEARRNKGESEDTDHGDQDEY